MENLFCCYFCNPRKPKLKPSLQPTTIKKKAKTKTKAEAESVTSPHSNSHSHSNSKKVTFSDL